MAKSKNHKVEVSETKRVVLVTILFLLLFLMSLTFDVVAQPVSKLTGLDKATLQNIGSRAFGALASVSAIALGFLLWGLPLVGALIFVVGLVSLALWYKYGDQSSDLRFM